MGTKRPHSETASHSNNDAQEKKRRFNPDRPPHEKKHKHNPAPAPNPLNPLKARIRSLRRLLAHDDAADERAERATAHMHPDRAGTILHDADELEVATKHDRRDEKRVKRLPAGVRLEHERELKSLEAKITEVGAKKKRADCIARWHKIRFFERRKAERRLKKTRKEGGDVHAAEVDLNYPQYWPLERDYVSLWPRRNDGAEQEERKGDTKMWKLVEKCMADGTLEDLREGRVEGCGVEQVKAIEVPATKKSKTQKKVEKAVQEDNDSDSDDGGFFE